MNCRTPAVRASMMARTLQKYLLRKSGFRRGSEAVLNVAGSWPRKRTDNSPGIIANVKMSKAPVRALQAVVVATTGSCAAILNGAS